MQIATAAAAVTEIIILEQSKNRELVAFSNYLYLRLAGSLLLVQPPTSSFRAALVVTGDYNPPYLSPFKPVRPSAARFPARAQENPRRGTHTNQVQP